MSSNLKLIPVSVTASLDSGSASATRARQDPPSDPPAAALSAHAVLADEGPDVKDQCREVIAERQSRGPPIAHAIVIESSDVEGSGKV